MFHIKRQHITALLMAALWTLFCGCQPDVPAQRAGSEPVLASPAASQVLAAAQSVSTARFLTSKQESRAEDTLPDVDARAVAQMSGCFACHTLEKTLVGPAWNEVAAKYRGQKDAEAKLIAKVAKGGSGVWGSVPMPPNSPRVSEGDIKALVHFILSLQ